MLPFFQRPKLSEQEKLTIIESLAIMLSSGIPILEALDSIAEDAGSTKTKRVMTAISQKVSGGKNLSEALADFPQSFDKVLVNIVKSGEASGALDRVLHELAANLKANIETANAIKGALFYPSLVLGALILVAFYMFNYALPKVAKIFFDLKIDLPAYSAFVLRSSLFFQKYSLFFIATFLVMLIALLLSLNREPFWSFFLSIASRLPVITQLLRFMDLARFTNTTSLLLKSGVPIIEVLKISKTVVISPKLAQDIDFVADSLTQGKSLAEAMKGRPESFPSILRRMVGVGEETGNLDTSLSGISDHYTKKLTDIVKNLTTLLEPILIIILAVLVGAILISIIVPIYQGISQLSPRSGL